MKRKGSAARSVEVMRLTVAANRVLSLEPEERYVYYLLGHFFNELMFLQKLLAFAIPKHEDNRPVRQQPEMGQVLILFRVAAGKLFEAKLALDKPTMSDVLVRSFLPLLESGSGRLEAFKQRVADSNWLKNLRNRHSFHYPRFDQWQHLVETHGEWSDDDVFMARQSGNVFYAGSDTMAQHWMFGQLNALDPRAAVEPMIDQLIELLRLFNGLVEDLLGAFVATRLLVQGQQPVAIGSVACPDFAGVRLPFWTAMPDATG